MKTKEEDKKSGSADRRFCGLRVCRGLGRAANRKYGGPRYQNRGNKARMYMKTKEEVKKSGSADRRFCGLRLCRSLGRAADRKNGGPRYQNRRNKARMFMKTKGRGGEDPIEARMSMKTQVLNYA